MPVSAAEAEDMRRQIAALPGGSGEEPRAIVTTSEVLAYVVAVARAEGGDELRSVELLVRRPT